MHLISTKPIKNHIFNPKLFHPQETLKCILAMPHCKSQVFRLFKQETIVQQGLDEAKWRGNWAKVESHLFNYMVSREIKMILYIKCWRMQQVKRFQLRYLYIIRMLSHKKLFLGSSQMELSSIRQQHQHKALV